MKKVVIFSAPSGSGKTTIVRHLLGVFPQLKFSVSATSRQPREGERDGVDYHFLSQSEFADAVKNEKFVEWEEVYAGTCYGTLRSEVERIWEQDGVVVFDVDVVGGVNLKKKFGSSALSIFIKAPSIEELERRLISRGTDSTDAIARRVAKAEQELSYANQFDLVITNDNLERAYTEAQLAVSEFI